MRLLRRCGHDLSQEVVQGLQTKTHLQYFGMSHKSIDMWIVAKCPQKEHLHFAFHAAYDITKDGTTIQANLEIPLDLSVNELKNTSSHFIQGPH
jgi:hypothetical protein